MNSYEAYYRAQAQGRIRPADRGQKSRELEAVEISSKPKETEETAVVKQQKQHQQRIVEGIKKTPQQKKGHSRPGKRPASKSADKPWQIIRKRQKK